jgi:hypothetical protein
MNELLMSHPLFPVVSLSILGNRFKVSFWVRDFLAIAIDEIRIIVIPVLRNGCKITLGVFYRFTMSVVEGAILCTVVSISRPTPVKIFCAPAASKHFPRRNPTYVFEG